MSESASTTARPPSARALATEVAGLLTRSHVRRRALLVRTLEHLAPEIVPLIPRGAAVRAARSHPERIVELEARLVRAFADAAVRATVTDVAAAVVAANAVASADAAQIELMPIDALLSDVVGLDLIDGYPVPVGGWRAPWHGGRPPFVLGFSPASPPTIDLPPTVELAHPKPPTAGEPPKAPGDGAAKPSKRRRKPPAGPATITAYPLLRPVGETPEHEVTIVPGTPLTLLVGIEAERVDRRQSITGGLGEIAIGEPITIRLAYDPKAFEIGADAREITVTPTAEEPYPRVSITIRPLSDPDAAADERRIAAHYFVGGVLRGIAVRALRIAGSAASPTQTSPGVIDLSPLVEESPPDVVLAVYRADAVTAGTYFLAAFPADPAVPPPPVGRIAIDAAAVVSVAELYRRAEAGGDAYIRYSEIIGAGVEIGRAIPQAIRATLQTIAAKATKKAPATMLLLTDDTVVPWELAAFVGDERLASKAGGGSPLLGAHFAIGRWPVSVQSVTRAPASEPIDVRRAALVTADYSEGIGGWEPLPGAVAEIRALTTSYAPAEVWPPVWRTIDANLGAEVDVIHFALHGTYTGRDGEDGLVFINERDTGERDLVYLGRRAIDARMTRTPPPFPRRPLVFLNACQVGRARTVLGDYSGLAASLIGAGARAVVACTWNIDDGVAGSISKRFYASADKGIAPAEILRRVRASYVVGPDTPAAKAPSPTLVAYQFYGHPRLRVSRIR